MIRLNKSIYYGPDERASPKESAASSGVIIDYRMRYTSREASAMRRKWSFDEYIAALAYLPTLYLSARAPLDLLFYAQ